MTLYHVKFDLKLSLWNGIFSQDQALKSYGQFVGFLYIVNLQTNKLAITPQGLILASNTIS